MNRKHLNKQAPPDPTLAGVVFLGTGLAAGAVALIHRLHPTRLIRHPIRRARRRLHNLTPLPRRR